MACLLVVLATRTARAATIPKITRHASVGQDAKTRPLNQLE
jgi:hypothetical protein